MNTHHPHRAGASIRTTVAIVGGGQAGLAMSRCLTRRGIDHVVIERGRIAERWRSERWDSLRLLTPNWMTRLPDRADPHPDPDGFMSMSEVVRMLDRYADAIDAPVLDSTTVHAASPAAGGFRLETSSGVIDSRFLVAATGACATPCIPAVASALPDRLLQTSPKYYRRPEQLPAGGVLVVGASASGVQLADELRASGRRVVLATGEHTRMPRRYRGLDIHEWLDLMGTLHRPVARRKRRAAEPSLQLIGSPELRDLGLSELRASGVEIAGRLIGTRAGAVRFDGGAAAAARASDQRLLRLLDRIDDWARSAGLESEIEPAVRPLPVALRDEPTELALDGIDSVVWATGYRPDFGWLDGGLTNPDGSVDHVEGVARSHPDLLLLGLPGQRTRRSTFIDGVGDDAETHAARIAARLARRPGARATVDS